MGGGILRIERDGPVEIEEGLVIAFARPSMQARHAAQEVVIGIEAFSRLAFHALYFGLLEPGRDFADHRRCNLILQFEYVRELSIKSVGPQIRSARRVDQ